MKHAFPLLLTGLLLLHASAAWAVPIQAGAARIEITPPVGYPLWGYAVRRDLPSTGVHDPLFARAVVLAVGQCRLAIVSLDLGRARRCATVKAIRERSAETAGVEPLFLVGSHTHHGPILELDNWPKEGKPYTRQLEDKIVAAIADAAKACAPPDSASRRSRSISTAIGTASARTISRATRTSPWSASRTPTANRSPTSSISPPIRR